MSTERVGGLGSRWNCYLARAKFFAEELQSLAENGEVASRGKVRENGSFAAKTLTRAKTISPAMQATRRGLAEVFLLPQAPSSLAVRDL